MGAGDKAAADEDPVEIVEMAPENPSQRLSKGTPGRMGLPRAPLFGSPKRSALALLALVGLATVVAATAVLVPLALPGSESSPEPSQISDVSQSDQSTDSASPSASPTFASSFSVPMPEPTIDAGPTGTPEPFVTPEPNPRPATGKWPIVWRPNTHFGVKAGPDGTLYMWDDGGGWSLALDSSGKERNTPLTTADGRHLGPIALGSDGTVLAAELAGFWESQDHNMVYALNPDGTVRGGSWPRRFEGERWTDEVIAGPNGTYYTTLSFNGELVILGPDGSTIASSTGSAGKVCVAYGFVRADGVFINICRIELPAGQTGPDGRIIIFDASAHKTSDDSAPLWQGIRHGGDGTVVAFRNNIAADETTPLNTQIAVIGTDGRPVAGWPVTIDGTVSEPTVGDDGTIYLVLKATSKRPAQILAYLPNGQPKPGWPYKFPAGVTPRVWDVDGPPEWEHPVEVVSGREGTIYIPAEKGATEYVYAIGPDATRRPGWPAALPERISVMRYCVGDCLYTAGRNYTPPEFVVSPDGSGLLFMHTEDHILALAEDGTVPSGWPKKGSFGIWAAMPNGGLAGLSLEYRDEGESGYVLATLYRWAPDGSLAH